MVVLAMTSVVSAALAKEPLTLGNRWLSVSVDPDSGAFSLKENAGGETVLQDGRWAEARGPAARTVIQDPDFGEGQCVALAGGKVMVFPDLPFALFRGTLEAGGAEPAVFNRVPLLSASAAVPGELKTIGTGGLQSPKDNTGSYAWLAIANPQTRSGIVGAWLTQDRGSGVVFSPATNGSVRIAAQVDYGRLRVKPGVAVETETFALGYFADARLGLEAFADAVAKHYAIKLLPKQSGFCTWYTEKHSRACDEKNLADLAVYAAKELKPYGLDFIQIDDGWQISGRVFESENPKGPYPGGMKATADGIAKLGLIPGLWFIPFAGDANNQAFREHQDRFYKDRNGKPFNARWGGTCLDMSVPETRDYLRLLIGRFAHEWGYKLFKMDGLWTGTGTRLMYVNNGYAWDEMGEAAPADPDKTQIECYRDGFKIVREAAGAEVFLLGCCVSQNMRSFGGAFGLVDAMRVGPDTGSGNIGAPHASRNYFLNGRVWWNDPDCVSVRARTQLEKARVNASFTAVSGYLFYNSDWMPDFPPTAWTS
ncbi:MAG: glycoside hydrolase family 36 protein [Kiritimatiellia bacterium]